MRLYSSHTRSHSRCICECDYVVHIPSHNCYDGAGMRLCSYYKRPAFVQPYGWRHGGSRHARRGQRPGSRIYHAAINPAQVPESSFTLEVLLLGSPQAYRVQLPILADMSSEPWSFTTEDLSHAKLVFKVSSPDFGKGRAVGTAVALLDSLRQGHGDGLERLKRDHTVAIIGLENFVGEVTFTFLVARPFHSIWALPAPQKLEPSRGTQIGGHCGQSTPGTRVEQDIHPTDPHAGLGQNAEKHKHQQLA